MQEQQPGRLREEMFGPRGYATLMICIGILALILATWQHRRDMLILRKHGGLLWARFLLLVAALVLQLVPSHPDRVWYFFSVSNLHRSVDLVELNDPVDRRK